MVTLQFRYVRTPQVIRNRHGKLVPNEIFFYILLFRQLGLFWPSGSAAFGFQPMFFHNTGYFVFADIDAAVQKLFSYPDSAIIAFVLFKTVNYTFFLLI